MGAESSIIAQPCACVVLLCFDLPSVGRPASPFIGEGKTRVTEEEKEKNEREEGFQDRRVLLLHVGPADPVDVNRDGSTSWPYSSLVPCAGITCWSWCSILS